MVEPTSTVAEEEDAPVSVLDEESHATGVYPIPRTAKANPGRIKHSELNEDHSRCRYLPILHVKEHSSDTEEQLLETHTGAKFPQAVKVGWENISKLSGVPVLGVFVSVNVVIFSIYNELPNNVPSNKRGPGPPKAPSELVISLSLGAATLIYCLFAVVGYVTWGDGVEGNVLNNYPPDAPVAVVARLVLVIVLMASFLVQFHPCKTISATLAQRLLETSARVVKRIMKFHQSTALSSDEEQTRLISPAEELAPESIPSERLRNLVAITLLLVAYLIAATVRDLSLVLALTGATGVTFMASVLPFVFYASMGVVLERSSLSGKTVNEILIPEIPRWKRITAWMLAALGLGMIVLSVAVILQQSR
ncbi:hypothetical protein HDU93_002429 [Gonapodya sp. JEL0774]|nr:hypothetical protein HDU93_002429 [Gonapodya sp. JEL0774]